MTNFFCGRKCSFPFFHFFVLYKNLLPLKVAPRVELYKDFFSSNLPSENSCNFLNIASKLTNEVPFERGKIYRSTDYNIMTMQQLHN